MKLNLEQDKTLIVGDFGDVGKDNTLHVSVEVFSMARTLGARTAEALYDMVNTSPDVVGKILNWSDEQVQAAAQNLEIEITKVRPQYFSRKRANTKQVHFGALPPRPR